MTPVDLKMTNFKAYVDRTKAMKYKTSMKTLRHRNGTEI